MKHFFKLISDISGLYDTLISGATQSSHLRNDPKTPGAVAEFNVQILLLRDVVGSGKPQHIPHQTISLGDIDSSNSNGVRVYTIPEIDTSVYDRIGLIITRLDNQESLDPLGEYSLISHQ